MRDGLRLDRDPALALEIHLVEELRALLALGERARRVQQPIGERALAVIDVRDDAEVADALVHLAVDGRASSLTK